MAVTDVTICNDALLHLGVTRFITSLADGTAESIPCNFAYARCRDRALEDFPWPFASRYVSLGQPLAVADGTQSWSSQWAYQYAYPSNCSRVIRIATGLGLEDPEPPPFTVGSVVVGLAEVLVLYCNVAPSSATLSDVFVEYTHHVTDTSLYTETFASAVSWSLSFAIAPALLVDPAIALNCYNMYLRATHQAERSLGNQSRRAPDADGPLLRARGG